MIFPQWIYLHWAFYREYLHIRNLNNLLVPTELFPTLDLLDWRIPYIYMSIFVYECLFIYVLFLSLVYILKCQQFSSLTNLIEVSLECRVDVLILRTWVYEKHTFQSSILHTLTDSVITQSHRPVKTHSPALSISPSISLSLSL